jgi:cob(I)alamin adenosyltransferase
MKVYTGSGDQGKTGLFSGERVSKSAQRIEAYGDVDELCAVIGLLDSQLDLRHEALKENLRWLQSALLTIGARLATTAGSSSVSLLEAIDEDDCHSLEQAIDDLDSHLPELRQFLLPGGHPTAAYAHLARTVCRRAERHVIAFMAADDGHLDAFYKWEVVFLNRLSDYFFVLARYLNQAFGETDLLWQK